MPPVIHADKCIRCETCTQICCMDVFGPAEQGTVPQVRWPEECWHCRACVMDCPTQAIELHYPLPMMMLWKDAPRRKEEPV